MLRSVLLAASRSPGARRSVQALPPGRTLARRFVAGDTIDDAVRVAAQLVALGMLVTVDHLGEDIDDRAETHQTVAAYQKLIDGLARAGLAPRAEVSVKLSALGRSLPDAGESFALACAFEIVRAATSAGVLVTLDMEDHTTTDSTLRILQHLRAEVPSVGYAVQAALRRTRMAGGRLRPAEAAWAECHHVRVGPTVDP